MSLLPAPAVFQSRDFSFYLTARFLSALAIQMQNVAVGWLVYDLTRDPFALGLVGLASFLPAVALALVTGHTADRYDRRKLMVGADLLRAAALGMIALLSGAGVLELWHIAALVVFVGAGGVVLVGATELGVPRRTAARPCVAW